MVIKSIEEVYNDTSKLHDSVTELYESLADKNEEEIVTALKSLEEGIINLKSKYEI